MNSTTSITTDTDGGATAIVTAIPTNTNSYSNQSSTVVEATTTITNGNVAAAAAEALPPPTSPPSQQQQQQQPTKKKKKRRNNRNRGETVWALSGNKQNQYLAYIILEEEDDEEEEDNNSSGVVKNPKPKLPRRKPKIDPITGYILIQWETTKQYVYVDPNTIEYINNSTTNKNQKTTKTSNNNNDDSNNGGNNSSTTGRQCRRRAATTKKNDKDNDVDESPSASSSSKKKKKCRGRPPKKVKEGEGLPSSKPKKKRGRSRKAVVLKNEVAKQEEEERDRLGSAPKRVKEEEEAKEKEEQDEAATTINTSRERTIVRDSVSSYENPYAKVYRGGGVVNKQQQQQQIEPNSKKKRKKRKLSSNQGQQQQQQQIQKHQEQRKKMMKKKKRGASSSSSSTTTTFLGGGSPTMGATTTTSNTSITTIASANTSIAKLSLKHRSRLLLTSQQLKNTIPMMKKKEEGSTDGDSGSDVVDSSSSSSNSYSYSNSATTEVAMIDEHTLNKLTNSINHNNNTLSPTRFGMLTATTTTSSGACNNSSRKTELLKKATPLSHKKRNKFQRKQRRRYMIGKMVWVLKSDESVEQNLNTIPMLHPANIIIRRENMGATTTTTSICGSNDDATRSSANFISSPNNKRREDVLVEIQWQVTRKRQYVPKSLIHNENDNDLKLLYDCDTSNFKYSNNEDDVDAIGSGVNSSGSEPPNHCANEDLIVASPTVEDSACEAATEADPIGPVNTKHQDLFTSDVDGEKIDEGQLDFWELAAVAEESREGHSNEKMETSGLHGAPNSGSHNYMGGSTMACNPTAKTAEIVHDDSHLILIDDNSDTKATPAMKNATTDSPVKQGRGQQATKETSSSAAMMVTPNKPTKVDQTKALAEKDQESNKIQTRPQESDGAFLTNKRVVPFIFPGVCTNDHLVTGQPLPWQSSSRKPPTPRVVDAATTINVSATNNAPDNVSMPVTTASKPVEGLSQEYSTQNVHREPLQGLSHIYRDFTGEEMPNKVESVINDVVETVSQDYSTANDYQPSKKSCYIYKDLKGEMIPKNVENVIIDANVTRTCPEAFRGCKLLRNVQFATNHIIDTTKSLKGDSTTVSFETCVGLGLAVVGLETIGFGSFYGCTSLTSIELPSSTRIIEDAAFHSASGLNNVHLPVGLTEIGEGAFHSCHNLKEIRIPSTLKNIKRQAFKNCKSLILITFPKKSRYITLGEESFQGCSSLFHITTHSLPPDLKEIPRSLFEGCENIRSVTIPPGTRKIGRDAFASCESLSKIDLCENLEVIEGGAFKNCSNLKEMDLPSNLKTIESGAFENCVELTHIEFPASLENLHKGSFHGCFKLKDFKLAPGSNLTVDDIQNAISKRDDVKANAILDAGAAESPKKSDEATATALNIDATDEDKVTARVGQDESSTVNNDGLQPSNNQATGKDGVSPALSTNNATKNHQEASAKDAKGPSNMPDPSEDRQATTEAASDTITHAETGAAEGPSHVPHPTGNQDATKVHNDTESDAATCGTARSGTFECELDPAAGSTSSHKGQQPPTSVGRYHPAYNNPALWHTSNGRPVFPHGVIEVPANAYASDPSVALVNIPQSVRIISYSAFSRCQALTSVDMRCATNFRLLRDHAFFDCCNLREIYLPLSLLCIGKACFSGCKQLNRVLFPNDYSLSSLQLIEDYAFYDCQSLKAFLLTPDLQRIGKYAFAFCPNLSTIIYDPDTSKLVDVQDFAFLNCPKLVGNYPDFPMSQVRLGKDVFGLLKRPDSEVGSEIVDLSRDDC